jgi:hypothetical protein
MRHQILAPPLRLEPVLEKLAVLAKEMRAAGYPTYSAYLLELYVKIAREAAELRES